ncbi:MAG: hypothetical protein PHS45_01615 [Bacilli bacterium]|nr:hypothetical protein [Bacilli bacterium]
MDINSMRERVKDLINDNEHQIKQLEIIADIFQMFEKNKIEPTPNMYEKLTGIKDNEVLHNFRTMIKEWLDLEPLSNIWEISIFNDIVNNNLTEEGLRNQKAVAKFINEIYLLDSERLMKFSLPIIQRVTRVDCLEYAEETFYGISNEMDLTGELLELYCEWLDGCRGVRPHIVPKLICATAFLGKADWMTASRIDFVKSIENDDKAAIKAALIAERLHTISSQTLPSFDFYDFLSSNVDVDYYILESKIAAVELLRDEEVSNRKLNSVKEEFNKRYGDLIQPQHVIRPTKK